MPFQFINPEETQELIKINQKLNIIDVRSENEYNTFRIRGSTFLSGDREFKEFVMQHKNSFILFLQSMFNKNIDCAFLVYDHNSMGSLQNIDNFTLEILELFSSFSESVFLLKGGFLYFQSAYPEFCWTNPKKIPSDHVVASTEGLSECLKQSFLQFVLANNSDYLDPTKSLIHYLQPPSYSCSSPSFVSSSVDSISNQSSSPSIIGQNESPLLTLMRGVTSQCSSKSHGGPLAKPPSEVLPHLYLGCQDDAVNKEICCNEFNFTHVLNVSVDGIACPFVDRANFLRIPIADNNRDSIITHFEQAFEFLEKVKNEKGRALVHCYAGISRSPTIAVGYLMRYQRLSMNDAYSRVRDSRTGVSPNFNFIGQLIDYERELISQGLLSPPSSNTISDSTDIESSSSIAQISNIQPCIEVTCEKTPVKRPSLLIVNTAKKRERPNFLAVTASSCKASSLSTSSDQSIGLNEQVIFERSPTEGKRSRVFIPLPSPSTHLSTLALNSPTDLPKRPTTLFSMPLIPISSSISPTKEHATTIKQTPDSPTGQQKHLHVKRLLGSKIGRKKQATPCEDEPHSSSQSIVQSPFICSSSGASLSSNSGLLTTVDTSTETKSSARRATYDGKIVRPGTLDFQSSTISHCSSISNIDKALFEDRNISRPSLQYSKHFHKRTAEAAKLRRPASLHSPEEKVEISTEVYNDLYVYKDQLGCAYQESLRSSTSSTSISSNAGSNSGLYA